MNKTQRKFFELIKENNLKESEKYFYQISLSNFLNRELEEICVNNKKVFENIIDYYFSNKQREIIKNIEDFKFKDIKIFKKIISELEKTHDLSVYFYHDTAFFFKKKYDNFLIISENLIKTCLVGFKKHNSSDDIIQYFFNSISINARNFKKLGIFFMEEEIHPVFLEKIKNEPSLKTFINYYNINKALNISNIDIFNNFLKEQNALLQNNNTFSQKH